MSEGLAEAIQAIANHTYSPNVSDSNGEAANLVDALDNIARGSFAIARAIERLVDEGAAKTPPCHALDVGRRGTPA
jgi:hypothetical protein